ncbi:MAG: CHAT domain-containing protein [Spirulina sp. SIO3F2]|nr:CHAT domain-containing protein [Spirulina sp. SIO3F2]
MKHPLMAAFTLPLVWLSVAPALYAQSITAASDGTGTIIQHNGNTYHIQGGTQAGANLFHSFQQFGLNTGEIANFLSNPGIANMFGRVVGGDVSIIDGLIQANPNLYLMNPAGIVFGANASLNIGGDFFATTADRIGFEGGWFNASGANNYRALVGAPNQFAFLSENPGTVLSFGELSNAQDVTFVAGTVLNQGEVISTAGNVTLAAVPGTRLVNLSQPGMLLSLEISGEAITAGIAPMDLPALLTGAGETVTVAAQAGDVAVGTVQGEQVDLYAAGQVRSTDITTVEGDTRVIRFTESGENPDQAVFIDARADDPEVLLYGAEAGTVSQIIERDESGVAVVSEQLAVISDSVGELESVAIVAEGNAGNFWLGSDWITHKTVGDYAAQLQNLGDALSANADLLLYSCFTALGEAGEALVNSIASMAGVDVAASVDVTGSSDFGGNWNLEHQVGGIEAGNPFMGETLTSWNGKLAIRTVQNLNDTGAGSLRDALTGTGGSGSFWATAVADGDEINFAPGVVGQIDVGNEIVWTVDNLTLDGPGRDDLILDGGGAERIFNISADNATLKNLTIQNGRETSGFGKGAGIYQSGTGMLTLENITIANNSASGRGSGIDSRGSINIMSSILNNNFSGFATIFSNSNVILDESKIVDNNGTGIVAQGDIKISSSRISRNSSSSSSGGVNNIGFSNLSVIDSIISDNFSGNGGGGILSSGITIIRNSTITGNSSSSGGGILSSGSLNIDGSMIVNNSSGSEGGGIRGVGDINIINSRITNNIADGKGGGIYNRNGNTALIDSIVSNNFSLDNGGGIYTRRGAPFSENGQVAVTRSFVSKNSAMGEGGGINGDRNVILQSSELSRNFSFLGGGGIRSNGNINIEKSTIISNSSQNGGGVIGIGNVTVTSSNISNNSASIDGGGILSSGKVVVRESTLDSNSAGFRGGDIDNRFNKIEVQNPIGELNLDIYAGNAVTLISSDSITITGIVRTNGNPFLIDTAQDIDITQLTLDTSSNRGGGNITMTSGGDINARNLLAFSIGAGDGGDISLTSQNGSISTYINGSAGLINTTSAKGNSGNVELHALQGINIGLVNTESRVGFGGLVVLETEQFIRIQDSLSAHDSFFNNFDASISSVGAMGGGSIFIRHGGNNLIPFIVGDANHNGAIAAITSGNSSTILPNKIYFSSHSQPGIQVLTNSNVYSVLEITHNISGSQPKNQLLDTKEFIRRIGRQAHAETFFSPDGYFSWDLPGEKSLGGSIDDNEILQELIRLDAFFTDSYAELEGESTTIAEDNAESEDEKGGIANIRETFHRIREQTGTNPVLVYTLNHFDALDLILVTPEGQVIRKIVQADETANRPSLRRTVRSFEQAIKSPQNADQYLPFAQQLHNWLIAPIQDELKAYNVDTLLFAMSDGLRTLPLAALHDGNQFLIEQYSLGMIPSVSLTKSNYQPLHNAPVVALGAAEFSALEPLPAVPVELNRIADNHPDSKQYLNEAFTLDTLRRESRNRDYGIVHLASHARFPAGRSDRAYIQFWDQPVRFHDLRSLGWHNDPQVELLVLSACETALGDPNAELGFAGLAVQTGVKSALASLWRVSDLGTLALMDGFYDHLQNPDIPIKAEALRQAQLELLRGEVALEDGVLGAGTLPTELAHDGDRNFTHPYYWSGFTLVGSPW